MYTEAQSVFEYVCMRYTKCNVLVCCMLVIYYVYYILYVQVTVTCDAEATETTYDGGHFYVGDCIAGGIFEISTKYACAVEWN